MKTAKKSWRGLPIFGQTPHGLPDSHLRASSCAIWCPPPAGQDSWIQPPNYTATSNLKTTSYKQKHFFTKSYIASNDSRFGALYKYNISIILQFVSHKWLDDLPCVAMGCCLTCFPSSTAWCSPRSSALRPAMRQAFLSERKWLRSIFLAGKAMKRSIL